LNERIPDGLAHLVSYLGSSHQGARHLLHCPGPGLIQEAGRLTDVSPHPLEGFCPQAVSYLPGCFQRGFDSPLVNRCPPNIEAGRLWSVGLVNSGHILFP
jgi:hypothetical protein